MAFVLYRTYGTTTGAQQNTAIVARDGRVVGVRIFGYIEAAAGTTTFNSEAAINPGTTVNYSINNPDRRSAISSTSAIAINATAANFDSGFIPCDCPIRAADVLTCSYLTAVTVPTRLNVQTQWVVEEK